MLFLILGGQISAQENKGSLFVSFDVHIDMDKESFLIGTLNDYMGHQQTFTVGSDSSGFLIKEILKKADNPDLLPQFIESVKDRYQFVDGYYPEEKNLALLTQSLFSSEFPDLHLIESSGGIRSYSASLSEIINGYYDYNPSGIMTVLFDTVYSGSLKLERLKTFRQKLSFLAGAFLRDGYSSESEGYYLSMPNSVGKAKLCSSLLKEFDCKNVVHKVFEGHIPCGNTVSFEPSETIAELIKRVKTIEENLESGEMAIVAKIE
jgi:hypothetical protein